MKAETREGETNSLECETSSVDFELREETNDAGGTTTTTTARIITRRDKVRGFSCVCIAAFIWVISSYWVKDLEKNGMTPLLVTSLANSMFTVLLPFAYLQDSPYLKSCRAWFSKRLGHREEGEALITRNAERGEKESASAGEEEDGNTKKEKNAVNRKRVFKLSLCTWPIWFLCLYIYNWSFLLTTVMSNTILSIGGTSFFTYVLELHLMKTAFSKTKLASISLCIVGTILWTYGNYRGDSKDETESKSQKNALLGNFLCLISSGLYAVTSIIVGKYLPEKGKEGEAEMSLFWGYTGLINLSVTMPLNIILALAGVTDAASLPAKMFGMVMVKGLMDNLLSNYLWAYAVLFVGPTSANVGMSIETPMVVVIDLVTRNASYLSNARSTALNVTGALVILMGFFGLSM
jgi:solute carrier family 35 protein F5